MIKITKMRTEHLKNPIGISTPTPRLSWKITGCKNLPAVQTAFRIQSSHDKSFQEILWDSGKMNSDQTIAILYNGTILRSMERIYWRVKVWCNEQESDFSSPSFFEMGLLNSSDWIGKWIETEKEVDINATLQEPLIRRSFHINKKICSARIYSTAHGLYEATINGRPVTNHLFLPGRTVYCDRLQYQVFDITDLLQIGENVLGIMIGDGWWRGSNSATNAHNRFGYKIGFLCQIVLSYEDGTVETIGSDHHFRHTLGPILRSDTKAGETYDARLLLSNWNLPFFDDSDWNDCLEVSYPTDNLISTNSVPVLEKESFHPEIFHSPNGDLLLDFKQNICGYVSFYVEAPAGTKITMEHTEVLDTQGNFTVKHYIGDYSALGGRNDVFQTVEYITSGTGREFFKPQFTFFGFRYVRLTGYPSEISAEDFTAHAVYSDMEPIGKFECSDQSVNQLFQNAIWSQKGNFLEVPSDCPTRERAGWTGDAQLYSKTASTIMDTYTFFEKWMQDVAADQTAEGKIVNITPTGEPYFIEEQRREAIFHGMEDSPALDEHIKTVFRQGGALDGSVGWGDAATIIPWTVYQVFGDKQILENQYESAKKWVNYLNNLAKQPSQFYADKPWYQKNADGSCDGNYLVDTGFHWGEWLEPDCENISGESDSFATMVAKHMTEVEVWTTTAYFAHSAEILSHMAEVLGYHEDAEYYKKLSDLEKSLYEKYFVSEDGVILENRQAPQARTLAFQLVSDQTMTKVASKLNEFVVNNNYHLNTGFLSTPFLLPMLARNGYVDTAYKLLLQREYPSWLFAPEHGATTICEHWLCYTPGMEPFASANHYAYGSVCDFLFTDVAGIQPLEPGYKKILIQPLPGTDFTYAKASIDSPYGVIYSEWNRTEDSISYKFKIPVNTTALLRLQSPNGIIEEYVGSGIHHRNISL